jgi:hypothetical protein
VTEPEDSTLFIPKPTFLTSSVMAKQLELLFIFKRFMVQALAWRLANVTDIFHGFSQSLQANARTEL